jgi:succinoglycan biosynthesis protein ExoA
MPDASPPVSVLVPVLDEIDAIDACLDSIFGQDYPGPLEVIVADGGSTDGTQDRLVAWSRDHPNLRVVHNTRRVQSHGLNLAAGVATGEYLVRMDAHTHYAPDYVRRSVAVLMETGAAAAGGPMRPVGEGAFDRAVAAAMRSPLTMGPGKFHHATQRQEVDTVYLGAFRRDGFLDLGGFRAFPSRVAEDADLYHRWRRQGGVVMVDPAIVSAYTPRDRPAALWRQYFRYGRGKAEMLFVNKRFPSLRPLAPLLLVLGLMAFGVLAAVGPWWPLVALAGSWLAVIGWVAVRSGESVVRVVAAAAIMHLAYGIGLLWGFLRGPGPVRRALEEG